MKEEQIIKKIEQDEGFIKHNNYHIVEAKEDNIIIKADLNSNSLNPYGFAHGGLIFGLGDTVMGMIARSTGRTAVTLDANINYLRPGTGKYIISKGEMI